MENNNNEMSNQKPTPPPKSSTYPPPLMIPPLSTHKQTFIILHGRGSNATTFGPPLLSHHISSPRIPPLPDPHHPRPPPLPPPSAPSSPHTLFILPTGPHTGATIYARTLTAQWFDNYALTTIPDPAPGLQIPGLRQSTTYIHSLIEKAVNEVGASNVVLGGLSQGGAAALVALVLWEGEALAAGFGLCSWVPWVGDIDCVVREGDGNEGDGEDDIFERDEDTETEGAKGKRDGPTQAKAFLREELGFGDEGRDFGMAFQNTPLFLGHGVDDERVPVPRGRDAVRCLEGMGVGVEWCEYEGLGHWFSREMLGDLVRFLERRTAWGRSSGDVDQEGRGRDS